MFSFGQQTEAFGMAYFVVTTLADFGQELRRLNPANGQITTFDLTPGAASTAINVAGVVNGVLYFSGLAPNGAATTTNLYRITSGTASPQIVDPTAEATGVFLPVGNQLYAGARKNGVYGVQRINADGSVQFFATAATATADQAANFVASGGKFYFTAGPGEGDLYVIDGNVLRLVKTINPGGAVLPTSRSSARTAPSCTSRSSSRASARSSGGPTGWPRARTARSRPIR